MGQEAELGITFRAIPGHAGTEKIGDRLIFSSFPEMYFNKYGKKLIDLDNTWQWDYCPYVVRNVQPKNGAILHLQHLADMTTNHEYLRGLPVYLSILDRYCVMFSMDCTIRHPRLYQFEDNERNPKKVILHTTGDGNQPTMMGEDAPKIMSDDMIDVIKRNYRNYDIVQIGSRSDKDAGVIDRRGLAIWETVEEISSASIFIGINSGPAWIAAAYPHISRKVIITEYDKSTLQNYFFPMDAKNAHRQWYNWDIQLFNRSPIEDWGVTTSYSKI